MKLRDIFKNIIVRIRIIQALKNNYALNVGTIREARAAEFPSHTSSPARETVGDISRSDTTAPTVCHPGRY